MISIDVVEQMMQIAKRVFFDDDFKRHYRVDIDESVKNRIPIASVPDAEYEFFLEIKQSAKKRLKVTLHFQNIDGPLPLLRIDYGGFHKNPEYANEHVPERFRLFCGQAFDLNTPHIHYFVQGYGLNWALPLIEDEFPVKSISARSDIMDAIQGMARLIKLETELEISFHEEAV